MAVVLDDGAELLFDVFGIVIAPMTMIHVVPSDIVSFDGTTLYANVLLEAAVFW